MEKISKFTGVLPALTDPLRNLQGYIGHVPKLATMPKHSQPTTVTIDSDYPPEEVVEMLRRLKTPTDLVRVTKSFF